MGKSIKREEKREAGMKKICMVASSGGHLEEISRLKQIEQCYDCFLVTEKSEFEVKNFCKKQYFVSQINRRELLFPFKFAALFFKAGKILRKEKPDFVITTGALISYPFCLLAKMKKKKVIYIESFARVHHASMTGGLVYRMADLFIVQWEDMLKEYPKSVLGGGIF